MQGVINTFNFQFSPHTSMWYGENVMRFRNLI